jgi:hypothetical protein
MLFDSWTITWFIISNVGLVVIAVGTYIYNEMRNRS